VCKLETVGEVKEIREIREMGDGDALEEELVC